MKIIKKFTFAALAATLLFQPSRASAAADLPLPVAIYDTFKKTTDTPGFLSWAGVVTVIIGPVVLNGTSRMDVTVAAGIAFCKFTWVIPDHGTLVTTYSVCKLGGGNGIGTWSIAKGTGSFKNFKAVGTETFGPLPPGNPATLAPGFYTDFERFAGIGTFNKKGDDEHGDDEHGDD